MSKNGKNISGPERMALLRRHLIDHVPVSQICDAEGIHPNVFYQWQKKLFEQGGVVFERKTRHGGDGEARQLASRVEALEKKLVRKEQVISEIMEEHVQLKKNLGET